MESTKSKKSEKKTDNETRKQEMQLIELMENDEKLTIELTLDNPEQATSYATVVKTAPPDRSVGPKEVHKVNKQRSPRDPNKTLIVTSKQTF